MKQIIDTFNSNIKTLDEQKHSLTQEIEDSYPSWGSDSWKKYRPVKLFIKNTRCGYLSPFYRGVEQQFEINYKIPFITPLLSDKALVSDSDNLSKKYINSLLLKLLVNSPPSKLRYLFIDPVGLGNSLTPFLKLADYDEKLITKKAWSTKRDIENQLSEIINYMETVIQKYLQNDHKTIQDYNQDAGELAEPYRIIVVQDYPTNFSDESEAYLRTIMANGPRCGVYTIITTDLEQVPFT